MPFQTLPIAGFELLLLQITKYIQMKTNRLYKLSLLFTALITFASCGEDRTYEYLEKTAENQWIFSTMSEEYLWADEIKSPERSDFFATPSKFFTSLLARTDKTSFFSDSTATTSYGMHFALMRDPLGEKMSRYYALVLNVEPGSPADVAGIVRGTWIATVNDKALTSSATALLTSGDAMSIGTQTIEFDDDKEKYVWTAGDTLQLQPSVKVTTKAIPFHAVYNVRSSKIGYILCNTLNGSTITEEFQDIILDFLSQNVTDIILDVRYCTGGTLENAANIASAFVPTSLAGTPFATLTGKEEETLAHPVSPVNASDKKLYIIMGNATKGAVETLIASVNASRGMYDVLTIGASSAGANVLTREFQSPFAFSINPAVALISASNGIELSAAGIAPDYPLDELEEIQHIYPLGNEREYILRNVQYLIVNGNMP